MSSIPVLGMLRQEDHRFNTSMDYIKRSCLKIKKKMEKVNSQFSISPCSRSPCTWTLPTQVSQAWAAGAAVLSESVCLYESLDQPAVTCPWRGSLTTFAQALSGSLHILNSFLDGLWRTARWQFYFILSLPGAPFLSLAFSQGHDSISQRGNVHGGDCSFNHCIDVARASHRRVKISGLQESNQGVFYKL